MAMDRIPISRLKNNFSALLRDVSLKKRKLVITRYGKPIAEIRPVDETMEDLPLKDTVLFLGNILSPVAEDEWEIQA